MSRDQRRYESKIDSYDAQTGVWIPAFAGMTRILSCIKNLPQKRNVCMP